VAIVTVAAIVRLVLAAIVPPLPDETYYWDWSRHLAAGYFDHPPGIALLIRLGDLLLLPFGLGATPLAIRLGPVVAGWIAAVATTAIARRLAGEAAATRAAIIITVLPLAAAGLILATPDSPLLAATAVGLYCVVRALQSDVASSDSLEWWTATGLILGVAFTSKYTSIFLPVGVVAAIVLRQPLRRRLLEPGPYVACVVATLVFLPVLIWNSQHEWTSFVYQVRHGLAAPQGSALLAAWKHEGDFFGGQAGLASPILFVMLCIAIGRGLRRRTADERFVLATVALLSFAFFINSALRQRVEPNWPSPAYIPGVALLAATTWSVKGERWMRGGVALAAALSVTIYVQAVVPILPIKPAKDPIARAFGWRELAVAADSTARSLGDSAGTTWIGGDRYQEASELAFYLPTHPATFATNLAGRPNQYDLWPRFPDRAHVGDNLILALDESAQPHDAVRALSPFFGAVSRGALVTLRRGPGVIGVRRLWVLRSWKGGWPEK
jgi:4-amino-4-deoxy-L-arabinose transferase-like glycosyltransferase